ncbi:endonuclease domain-containing protein [Microbacterium sp. HJ5]
MRSPLPPELGNRFTTAAALAAGVKPSRLRSSDLVQPFHGVRAVRAVSPEAKPSTPEDRVLELVDHYALRMTEHEFFTHVAAAVIWGLPLPITVFAGRPLDVGVFAPRRNASGSRTKGHSVKPGFAHVVRHPELGVRVTTPASTWAMLGGDLQLRDLVAVADAAVRVPMHENDRPALATIDQLRAALSAGRRTGIARLRTALPLVCERSCSRPETWLRLLLIDARLAVPSANFDVYADGRWIARVDLAYPDLRIALEYEGEHHLTDSAQWHLDIARAERLVEAGWRVIRVTKADVFRDPAPLIDRVRRAIALAAR